MGHSAGLEPIAVGHRVVHGGPVYAEPVLVDDRALEILTGFVPLVPAHPASQPGADPRRGEAPPRLAPGGLLRHGLPPHGAAGRRDVRPAAGVLRRRRAPGTASTACRTNMSSGPSRTWTPLSPQVGWSSPTWATAAAWPPSGTARAWATRWASPGWTASPWGPGAARSTPGVLIHLMQQRGMSLNEVEDLLYNHSGLKGLSGVSNDMRDLLASDHPDARLAVDYFVHRVGRELGSLTAVLGGLDALVFTAGIGEHSAEVRAGSAAARRGWASASTTRRTAGAMRRISRDGRSPSVWVIPTDEERMIAEHTLRLVRDRAAPGGSRWPVSGRVGESCCAVLADSLGAASLLRGGGGRPVFPVGLQLGFRDVRRKGDAGSPRSQATACPGFAGTPWRLTLRVGGRARPRLGSISESPS